jgi:alpha-glucosidase
VADYCDVDPRFGTLADFDALISSAHEHGLRVTIDLVPNHCSDQHPRFRQALAARRGSPERAWFHFVEGRGPGGAEPPNNWRSVFGGPPWTRVSEPDGPGQWYYHLFAAEQPDFNWDNPAVLGEFDRILGFWLDRGVDGFRIDVSDALIKDVGWADTPDGSPVILKDDASAVHDVYRHLRRLMDTYPGERMAVVETGAPDDVVALFVRRDEMHLAFNLRFTKAAWGAEEFRQAIRLSLAANAIVGAPATWVTDNHDNPRSVTRYASGLRLEGDYVPQAVPARETPGRDQTPGRAPVVGSVGLARGVRRSRAAALLLLSLPGAAYIYAGQELGLPNVDDLPDEAIQDPVFRRTAGAVRGRDGCRVPLPWSGTRPPFGFSAAGVEPWLPMPAAWQELTVEAQDRDPASALAFFRRALALRRAEPSLRGGTVTWLDQEHTGGDPTSVLRLARCAEDGRRVVVVANFGDNPTPLPPGEVLLASVDEPLDAGLPGDAVAVLAAR